MKIYFDGCSFAWGSELQPNHKEQRYSKLICNHFGAEETNCSSRGGSNDRIVRNLLVENDIEEYDLAIIQMTFPVRTEYWDEKKNRWIKVKPNGDHGDHWTYHYKYIHNEYYSYVKENIQSQTIRNHCKAHNVPVILLTINPWSKVNFDYMVKLNDKTRVRGHPNKLGHQIIANDLLKYYENLL